MADGGTDRTAAGELLVRDARPADGEVIIGLLDELGYRTDAATLASRYGRLLDDEATWIFVAERGRRVVGFASLHVIPLLERVPMGRLTALVVSEGARGRGTGRALVERVQDEARRQGCDRLEVSSGEWRREAHAFYVSVGFQKASRRFMKAME